MVAFLLVTASIQAAYVVYGVDDSTNWNIAYNASNYALIAAVAYDQADKYRHIVGGRMFLRFLSLLWGYFMIAEIGYINQEYETYRHAASLGNLFYQMWLVVGAAVLIVIMDRVKKYAK